MSLTFFYTFHTFLRLRLKVTIHKVAKKKIVYINFVPSSVHLQYAILHSIIGHQNYITTNTIFKSS